MSEKRKTLKVAGLGNFSLLQSHIDYLSHLGNGNKSEGVRRLIARDKAVALLAQEIWEGRFEWGSEEESLQKIVEHYVSEARNANSQLPEPD